MCVCGGGGGGGETCTYDILENLFFVLLSAWKRELYLTAMAINIIILLSGPRCIPCCRFNFQFFFLNQFLSSFIIVIVNDVILRYKLLHYVCVCLSVCIYLSLCLSLCDNNFLSLHLSLSFYTSFVCLTPTVIVYFLDHFKINSIIVIKHYFPLFSPL